MKASHLYLIMPHKYTKVYNTLVFSNIPVYRMNYTTFYTTSTKRL